MQLPIILLNWNNLHDTNECISSILKYSISAKIYLIDNNSNDSELLKETYFNNPQINLRLNKQNFGFTLAHNPLFKEIISKYDYVFLLNNDTIIDQSLIENILKLTETKNPDMLSCKMINYWNRELMDNAGHKMYTSGEIVPLGQARSIDQYMEPFENIGACAGAAVYSTAMLKDIGLFDEYFDTGYEDAELGLRAFIAGYKCMYEPNAIVYHKMSRSINKIFDFDYAVKIQTNIYYSYLKLVHWQVIAINLIPWLSRFFLITFFDLIFWRPKYLKVQYHALYLILFRDWKKVMKARKESKILRRIPWYKLLEKQEFFLKRDIQNFYKFIIKGEKSYFEKY